MDINELTYQIRGAVFDCGLATKLRSASYARQADSHPSEMVSEFHGAGRC